jgi:hypothetical protein
MPMAVPSDYAAGNTAKDYCRFCARPDGTMQSYEEKLRAMGAFLVQTLGLDEGAAVDSARVMMARLPAWKER